MFEPFVEDEVPFDEYCQSMGEDGTWAGHMELQAASLVTHSNICIHRVCYNTFFILMVQDMDVDITGLHYFFNGTSAFWC